MSQSFRSGNSRMLARTFDELGHPLALLDRRGAIVFVNDPMCRMLKGDNNQLVGLQCSWQIPPDETPFAAALTALAPPAGALQGKIIARQLSKPIVFGSTHTGQLFLPLLDDEANVQATLVVLGTWSEILKQLPQADAPSMERRRHLDNALLHIRSSWQTLDGLHSVIGTSAAMELAMARAQLAAVESCSFFVYGPKGVGKTELVNGIFLARLKRAGLAKVAGQLFSLACATIETELLSEMLDVFQSRFRSDSPAISRLLVFEQFERLNESGVQFLNAWLQERASECCIAAISHCPPAELAARGAHWAKLLARTASIEIGLPPLRERREDILPLAQHCLAATCLLKGRAPLTFTDDALQLLTAFPWPENTWQLWQAIAEAVNHAVLATAIQVTHLPTAIRTFASTVEQLGQSSVEPIDLDQILLEVEKTILQRALKLSPRNRAQAARLLGISRPRLLRRIEQLGLDCDQLNEPE